MIRWVLVNLSRMRVTDVLSDMLSGCVSHPFLFGVSNSITPFENVDGLNSRNANRIYSDVGRKHR